MVVNSTILYTHDSKNARKKYLQQAALAISIAP